MSSAKLFDRDFKPLLVASCISSRLVRRLRVDVMEVEEEEELLDLFLSSRFLFFFPFFFDFLDFFSGEFSPNTLAGSKSSMSAAYIQLIVVKDNK